MLWSRWQVKEITTQCQPANSRVHLSGGSVTALARKPMSMNHHLMLPGPRRTSPAGDANVIASRPRSACNRREPMGWGR
jgi:hypothetical protein